MRRKDLTKDVLYEGVKNLLESEADHIHLPQQKLYTLYSVAFNYFLYLSSNSPGHYIIRVEDSYLIEKLIRKAKDDTSRKFLQKMALPRKFKYGKSLFHIDFFNIGTWSTTNELPKEKVKGALIVKNANKSPIGADFVEDEAMLQVMSSLPTDYYYTSLKEFVPKTIVIAFEEHFEGTAQINFPFIKEDPTRKLAHGVSISGDINVDDFDDH